ncbi:hypothetical protein [Micromonospora maritima]|uniref:hypothetical protein n=1 Tax=Micromonospora maritima TaxID=986711 RepID=UPI00157BE805|nr:hypothetical protein [Micromonospora maritima]
MALAEHIRAWGRDVREVVSWAGGYNEDGNEWPDCDTCENSTVEVRYIDSEGAEDVWVHYGDLGELVDRLISEGH